MKFSDNLAKALFVLSLVVFILLYGVAAGNYGWFPRGFLDQALDQARNSGIYQSLPFIGGEKAPQWTKQKIYELEGVKMNEPEKVQPGLTLIPSLWDWDDSGDLEAGAKLIDQEGRVIHSWKVERDKVVPESVDLNRRQPESSVFQGMYLFPNGDLLLSLDYIGTVRVDACGEIVWRLPEFTHHSIHRAEDGTFWIPAVYGEKRTGSERYPNGFPGLQGKKVWVERILHVSEQGKILNDINVLDLLYRNNLERYISKFNIFRPNETDLTHLNDVEPLKPSMVDEYPLFEAGDLLVSLRNINLVFVFDPETLEVKWHTTGPFIRQHDPDFVGNGWITVFDNNREFTDSGRMLGGSRIVKIQPHTGKVKIQYPAKAKHLEHFYTPAGGKVQVLENENKLLTEANTGRIIEIAPDGSLVWEWVHPTFDDSYVPQVYNATRYNLTKEGIASWSCSSVSTSENTEQEGG